MPSLIASLTGFVLRTTGIYRRMYSGGPQFQKNIAKVRAERLAEPDAKARNALRIEQSEFGGRPVWHLAPRDREPSAHIFYWHGGGPYAPGTIFLKRVAGVAGDEISVQGREVFVNGKLVGTAKETSRAG